MKGWVAPIGGIPAISCFWCCRLGDASAGKQDASGMIRPVKRWGFNRWVAPIEKVGGTDWVDS